MRVWAPMIIHRRGLRCSEQWRTAFKCSFAPDVERMARIRRKEKELWERVWVLKRHAAHWESETERGRPVPPAKLTTCHCSTAVFECNSHPPLDSNHITIFRNTHPADLQHQFHLPSSSASRCAATTRASPAASLNQFPISYIFRFHVSKISLVLYHFLCDCNLSW